MKEIFTVTAVTRQKDKNHSSRCFGFFFDRDSAIEAIKTNHGDMEECYYSYIVLERQYAGIHALATQMAWYKWVGPHSLSDSEVEGKWVELQGEDEWPEFSHGIINWNGIG
jgi:hypothetical protein